MHNAGLVLPVVAQSSMASFGLFSRIFYREVIAVRSAPKILVQQFEKESLVFCFCFYRMFVFLPRARRSVLFLRRRPKLIQNNKTHYWQENVQCLQQGDIPTLCTLQNSIAKYN